MLKHAMGSGSRVCVWFAGAVIGMAQMALGGDGPPNAPMKVPMSSADGVQRATVILDSYSYSPDHLIVEAGKPVELTLTSVTTITPHNFVINDPAGGLSVEQDVGAGKTAVVKFTPARPGTFSIYCDKKLLFFRSHREKGMEGKLEVR
ncbi:MAG TPA: cupredoxin domain-containing protein [Nitrospira sp.]|nr:cupredoxin domain-containing protein [Nitrospira sp.]